MFKNLTILRFPPATGTDILCRLTQEIAALPLRDLEPSAMLTVGFVPPGQCEDLDQWIGLSVYVCVAIRKRTIAPKQIAEILERRCKVIELEGRTPTGRERKRMREEIVIDLMPHAPITTKRVHCLIHPGENWIALDTASPQHVDICISHLHVALGSFPALPLAPVENARAMLTEFLSLWNRQLPQFTRREWVLGNDCVLIGENESKASYAAQELSSDEIARNLEDGKTVDQLGIVMREHVSGTLTTDLVFKRLKFLDGCALEDVKDQAGMLALQALELGIVVNDVFSIFQCEVPE